MFWLLSAIASFLSAEWILTRKRWCHSNGGDVILFRSLWTAAWVFAAALGLKNIIDPRLSSHFDLGELQQQLVDVGPGWYGAIFAATYAALYARFASQWTYLAGVYNRIKETQARVTGDTPAEAMAQWKAGFIEDADDLHLATKPMFASVIKAWGNEPAVMDEFKSKHIIGGECRLHCLLRRVESVVEKAQQNYQC